MVLTRIKNASTILPLLSEHPSHDFPFVPASITLSPLSLCKIVWCTPFRPPLGSFFGTVEKGIILKQQPPNNEFDPNCDGGSVKDSDVFDWLMFPLSYQHFDEHYRERTAVVVKAGDVSKAALRPPPPFWFPSPPHGRAVDNLLILLCVCWVGWWCVTVIRCFSFSFFIQQSGS